MNTAARWTRRLSWLGLLLPLVAVMRPLIAFTPRTRFDTDPLVDPDPFPGLGPAGSLALDAVALLGAALLCIFAVARARSRTAFWVALLAIAPLGVIFLQSASSFGDLWRGATWAVGAIGAASLALFGSTRQRRLAIILLLSVCAPLAVRGVNQWLGEHDATVSYFQAHKAEFLQARGWAPDSPEALTYERRLQQREATGWLGLANVYSSVMAGCAVSLLGLGLSAARLRVQRAPTLVVLLLGLVASALVLADFSKGAVIAFAIGLVVLASLLAVTARSSHADQNAPTRPRFLATPWIVTAISLCGLLAVFLRGAAFSEGVMGEKSLLFRWYYMTAAFKAFAIHPWLGVGADGFQDAFLALRSDRSPEEVVSAHSCFLDWSASLGVLGLCWCALALWMIWSATRGVSEAPRLLEAEESDATAREPAAFAGMVAAAGGLGAFLCTLSVEQNILTTLVRFVGVMVMATLGASVAELLRALPARVIRASLTAGALVVLLHGQLDMVFWQPGSALWAWLIVGIAVPGEAGQRAGMARMVLAVSALFTALVAAGAATLAANQAAVVEAAAAQIIAHKHAADGSEAFAARLGAGTLLQAAGHVLPTNESVWRDAVDQYLLASNCPVPAPQARSAARLALLAAKHAYDIRPSFGTARAIADARWRLALLPPLPTEEEWKLLIQDTRLLLDLNPRSTMDWVRLGEVLAKKGDELGARQAFRQALVVDATYDLDLFKQLPKARRQRLEKAASAPLVVPPPEPEPEP